MFKKKLKLDFYTAHETLIDLQPIQQGTKPPTWWKQIKKSYDKFRSRVGIKVPVPTVRTCPGVVDYIRRPITIKMWSDGIFKVKPTGIVECIEPFYGAKLLTGSIHDSAQYGGAIYKDRVVFKLEGPWCVKASDDSEFMITECHYTEDLRSHGILISPGITNFYHQHTLNVFLVIPIKEEEYTFTLKYGTPLMSIYPMHEKEMDIEMHKINREFFSDFQNVYPSKFIGRYYTGKNALKD